jgi:hypothetical protein
MTSITKLTQAEKIGQLEAGLDFQNRESTHILEMVRKHHVEIQDQAEFVDGLMVIMRVYAILLLSAIGLTLFFILK